MVLGGDVDDDARASGRGVDPEDATTRVEDEQAIAVGLHAGDA